MPWVKLDDRFFSHIKVVRAGRDARDLFLAALCYANEQLTDGMIPADTLDHLAAEACVSDPANLAHRLVNVHLWEEAEGGFLIHDYHEFNPSAQKVRDERIAARERMQKVRENVHVSSRDESYINEERSGEVRANIPRSSVTPYPVPYPVPVPGPGPGPGEDTSTSAEVEASTAVPASLHDFEYFSKELRAEKANRPAILCLAISDVFGRDCREFGRVGKLAGSSAGEMLKKIYKFRPDWNGVDNPVDYLTIQINGGHVGNGRPNAMKAPPRASPTASDLAISRADDLVRRESLRREGVPSIYSSEPPAFNPLGSGD